MTQDATEHKTICSREKFGEKCSSWLTPTYERAEEIKIGEFSSLFHQADQTTSKYLNNFSHREIRMETRKTNKFKKLSN